MPKIAPSGGKRQPTLFGFFTPKPKSTAEAGNSNKLAVKPTDTPSQQSTPETSPAEKKKLVFGCNSPTATTTPPSKRAKPAPRKSETAKTPPVAVAAEISGDKQALTVTDAAVTSGCGDGTDTAAATSEVVVATSRSGRRTKRVRYFDSEEEEEEEKKEGEEGKVGLVAEAVVEKKHKDAAFSVQSKRSRKAGKAGASEASSTSKGKLKRAPDTDSEDEFRPDGDASGSSSSSSDGEMSDGEIMAAAAALFGDEDFSAPPSEEDEPATPPRRRKAPVAATKKRSSSSSSFSSSSSSLKISTGGGGSASAGSRRSSSGGGAGGGLGVPVSAFEARMVSAAAEETPVGVKKGKKKEDRHSWIANPRDKNKNLPGHPEYDPTTLYIPASAWDKLSPFERQYFKIKQNMWDTILFFKKGKFYELYERDAEAAHREFNLKISDRVNMMLAGVPESSFVEWASKFLGLGYKVAKADEQETLLAKQIREKNGKGGGSGAKNTKVSKIIGRELAAVFTAGTLTGDFLTGDMSNFIMCITEDAARREYGVCFADTATAEFWLCHFVDDSAGTSLETLIVQTMPKEIVYPKGRISKETMAVLKNNIGGAQYSPLDADDAFWGAAEAVHSLEMGGYFNKRAPEPGVPSDSLYATWPAALVDAMDEPLSMSAFGGLVAYFRTLLLDENLLGQGSFRPYDPLQHGTSLILDGQTLLNLEILENSVDRGRKGTLAQLLCHCSSPFGRRLFHRWLCHPLRNAADIDARFDALEDLESEPTLVEELRTLLRSTPDLERLISRVHVGSCKFSDFVALIEALQAIDRAGRSSLAEQASALRTPRLRRLLTPGQLMPDLSAHLDGLFKMFDLALAKRSGQVLPSRGVDAEYDALCKAVEDSEAKLNRHLKEIKMKLGPQHKVAYWHPASGKEIYQLVVPTAACRKVPSSWTIKSSTKNVKRFWSPEVERIVPQLVEARELRRQAVAGFYSKVLVAVDAQAASFNAATGCLAELDCMLSLLDAKGRMGQPMCRPTFVERAIDSAPILEVEDLRHPCLVDSGAVSDYIPNDTRLGSADGASPPMIVLTGPNMGGKSTLLRQTCVAVIMAQLGCWVPAKSMRLSPVDRIFTRIGANDNIVAGRSTFMVELRETASILNQATRDSLVILDELGRGTSTFDGYSIAHAVLAHLADATRCRGMFATHYHMLTDEFSDHQGISMQNMACVVEEGRRDVTFLYKLQPGVCSKSYGMNVAAMAGMPRALVDAAEAKAAAFEAGSQFGHITERVAARRRQTKVFQELAALPVRGEVGGEGPGAVADTLKDLVARARAAVGAS